MSQTTRCPHCGTTFRVVPDQLRIGGGWVRCGQCKEVFDATEQLHTQAPPAPLLPDLLAQEPEPAAAVPMAQATPPQVRVWSSARVEGAIRPAPVEAPAAPPPALPPDVPAFLLAAPQQDAAAERGEAIRLPSVGAEAAQMHPPEQEVEGPQPTAPVMAPEPVEREEPATALQVWDGLVLESASVPALETEPTPGPLPEPEPERVLDETEPQAARELVQEPLREPEPVAASPLQPAIEAAPAAPATPAFQPAPTSTAADDIEPEFVRAARRGAFWRHPAVRGLLTLLALALAGLLALQLALRHRDLLAARQPALRAVLQPLCQQLGCTLSAPRTLGAVVIDSSSFTSARSGTGRYELRFALKNTADHVVAMPMVELTLTDSDDQPLLRRVLDPGRELGAGPELAAGTTWSARSAVELADVQPVAGYRLLAFYP